MVAKKATKKATKKSAAKVAKNEVLEHWIKCRKAFRAEMAKSNALLDPRSRLASDFVKALREAQKHFTDSELATAWFEATSKASK